MADIISERPTITEVHTSDGGVGLRVRNVVYMGYDQQDLIDAWDYWHTHVIECREERQGGESVDNGGMDSHIPDHDPLD